MPLPRALADFKMAQLQPGQLHHPVGRSLNLTGLSSLSKHFGQNGPSVGLGIVIHSQHKQEEGYAVRCSKCNKEEIDSEMVYKRERPSWKEIIHHACPNGHKWHTDIPGQESECNCP